MWWKAVKVLKKALPTWLYEPLLPLYHLGQSVVANIQYGFPARDLKIVAITGTNGKTTTAHYIASILEAAGYKVGLSTTARFKIGDKEWDNDQNMTVTQSFALARLLKQMKEAGCEWVVLEVTSHSLEQHRVWGIPIHSAVITNLTQDHLDYHQTMDEYAAAKGRLLKYAKVNAILNHDDQWFKYFLQLANQHKFTYGSHREADVRILRANLRANGAKIKFRYGHDMGEVIADLKLTGKFNVYNALAAAAFGYGLELNSNLVKRGLESLKAVPGRMEAVVAGQKFSVIVDYAHTPDAFRNIFETLRSLTRGKLIVVFGATGDRDKAKRPLMGSIAARNCEIVIVSDDDPYTEDVAIIRKEVLAGARHANSKAKILEVGDRRKAIARAFELATGGDTVAILGLGHQHYRVVGDKKEAWDDRQVAKDLLAPSSTPVKRSSKKKSK